MSSTNLLVADPGGQITSSMATMEPQQFGPIFNEAFQTLRRLVVGNDPQLMQAMFALGSLEHVLWIAGPGTGKSMTAELIMGMFPDAGKLALQLTKDTSQEAIFGHLVARELIEEGREVRNLEGGLGDVEFFYADEFMDASPWAIRTMLNVLNERVVRSKDGGQVDAPLHSVIATTNFYRTSGELEAVVDRFLAIAVMSTANRLHQHFRIGRGYTKTSGKEIVVPTLNYADLLNFAEWIESPEGPMISDAMMTLHYVLLIEFLERRYQHELKKWAAEKDVNLDDEHNAVNKPSMRDLGVFVTPRRSAKALDFVKASAGFEGRDVVNVNDLRAAGLVYCIVGDDSGHDQIWNELCDEYLGGIKDRDLDQLEQIGQLTDYLGELYAERGNASDMQFAVGGESFLVTRRSMLDVRNRVFGRKRNRQPAVVKALQLLDQGIEELDEDPHATGVRLDLWCD